MDSVFQLIDPLDQVEKNIILNHPHYTVLYVRAECTSMVAACPFGKQNLIWSHLFFFDSLTTRQQLCIGRHLEPNTPGALFWMHIMQENQLDTTHALCTVIDELQDMKLSSFPGKNVHLCTQQIDEHCCCLEAISHLPDDIGATICNVLTKTSVDAFCIPFYNKYWELDKNPSAYTYHELIQEADSLYNSLSASKQWLETTTAETDQLTVMYADLKEVKKGLAHCPAQGGQGQGCFSGRNNCGSHG